MRTLKWRLSLAAPIACCLLWSQNNILPALANDPAQATFAAETDANPEYDPAKDGLPMRYDYKQTLKKPFYYNHTIPFWDVYGRVIQMPETVRLNPSVPGLTGAVWAQLANDHNEWQVKFSFMASGRGNAGGKGLAFWYTKDRGSDGPIFGSQDHWDGLGIFFATYDGVGERHDPAVYGVINDGSTSADHVDFKAISFGSCTKKFRNPTHPVRVLVSYYNQRISVSLDISEEGRKYEPCFSVSGVALPKGFYFGVSAEAGSLADDHDLYSFETSEVNPYVPMEHPLRPHEKEKIDQGHEFNITEQERQHIEEIKHKVEEAKHKEETAAATPVPESKPAPPAQDSQNAIAEALKALQQKIENGNSPPAHASTPAQVQIPPEFEAKINTLSTSLERSSSQIQHLNDLINKLNQEVTSLKNALPDPSTTHKQLSDVQTSLHHVTQKLNEAEQRSIKQENTAASPIPPIPDSTNALSGPLFIFQMVLLVLQLGIMWFIGWRPRSSAPKKFI